MRAFYTQFSFKTADSKTVVFRRFGVPFWVAADGSGRMGQVPGGVINDYPSSPGPDSDSIIGVRINPDTSGDVYLFLIQTPAYEGGAQLSFDGRWLLYQSNESGQPEIYVRRFTKKSRLSSPNPTVREDALQFIRPINHDPQAAGVRLAAQHERFPCPPSTLIPPMMPSPGSSRLPWGQNNETPVYPVNGGKPRRIPGLAAVFLEGSMIDATGVRLKNSFRGFFNSQSRTTLRHLFAQSRTF